MYTLLLLNGGIGQRVGAGEPKQFITVNDVPALAYSLLAADAVPDITQLVMNFPSGWFERVEAVVCEYGIRTPVRFIQAGATRQESVQLMLAECDSDRILIHESARPLVRPHDFVRLIDGDHDNVTFVTPLSFTIAPVDVTAGRLTGYLERSTLRGIRLPQRFDRATLQSAHEWALREGLSFTEDATMCAQAGHDVFFIDAPDHN